MSDPFMTSQLGRYECPEENFVLLQTFHITSV